MYTNEMIGRYKKPSNKKVINHNASARVKNSLCGDDVEMYIYHDGSTILNASFDGEGCCICVASADMLCDKIKGMSINESLSLSVVDFKSLSLIEKSRYRCAELSLIALREALNEE